MYQKEHKKTVQQKSVAHHLSDKKNNVTALKDNRESSIIQQQQIDSMNSSAAIQKKKNNTGLPDNLKSGMESISGHSLDDVKVHYNSSKPAQLNAHAYAQGTNIHVASGQEKHLPHEAWHIVQQKQGRVKPTIKKNGVAINDDKSLEKEADVMGAKALQRKVVSNETAQLQKHKGQTKSAATIQKKSMENNSFSLQDNRAHSNTVQRMQKGVVQRNPFARFFSKPLYMANKGKGFIPLMHSQFNPKFRTKDHQKLLDKVPKGQNPFKTFLQENHLASKFPYEGSYSKLGDAGITAHKTVAAGKRFLYGSQQ